MPDRDQRGRVDTVDHHGVGAILMCQSLELLRERSAERELEAVEGNGVVLRRFEDVDAADIGWAKVLDFHRPIEAGFRRSLRRLGGGVAGRGGRGAARPVLFLRDGEAADRGHHEGGEGDGSGLFHMDILGSG